MSSGTELVYSSPKGQAASVGIFLSEMGAILERFKEEYEYIFATPDGARPTFDVNGLALSFQAGSKLTKVYTATTLAQTKKNYSYESARKKYNDLVERRQRELELFMNYVGKIPISELLPKTDKEVKEFYPEVVSYINSFDEKPIYSIQDVLDWDTDADNNFNISELAFVHYPGGHAPIVDFPNNPIIGELINRTYDGNVLQSFICHAPVALTSARFRIDEAGNISENENHPFEGITVTTVPKHAENITLDTGYPHIPHEKTRIPEYVDVLLKEQGYKVKGPLNFSAPYLEWNANLKVLTGNGPQTVDIQADKMEEVLKNS